LPGARRNETEHGAQGCDPGGVSGTSRGAAGARRFVRSGPVIWRETPARFPRLPVVPRLSPFRNLALVLAALVCPSIWGQAPVSGVISMPFQYVSRHVMVEASVGSSDPIWLVVDTGAGSTLIDSQVATALHLELNGRVTVGGAGAGTQTGSFVRGAQYQFANKANPPQNIRTRLSRL